MKARHYSPSQQAKRAAEKAEYEARIAPVREAQRAKRAAEQAEIDAFMARPENRHLDALIKQHCGI